MLPYVLAFAATGILVWFASKKIAAGKKNNTNKRKQAYRPLSSGGNYFGEYTL